MNTTDTALLQAVADERTRQTIDLMRRNTIDHLLLGNADNIRFVSNYRSLIIHETADHMYCVMNEAGEADIFGPHLREPYENKDPTTPAVREVHPLSGWVPGMSEPRTTIKTLARAIGGARHVGYDAIHPELLHGLQSELPTVRFTYIGASLMDVRRVKLPGEITLMEAACAQNQDALGAAFASAAPGVSDRELLAAALEQQQRLEAELITHSTCNVRAPFGNWFPNGSTMVQGQAIFIDQVYYGPGGYASDLTRTKFVGEPPAQALDAYRRLVEVAHTVADAAKPGTTTVFLDELLNESLRRNGLAPSPYGLGHGIGLRVMEPPSLVQRDLVDDAVALRHGEVIALEPETSVDTDSGTVVLKVEDCFRVEDSGLRPLGPQASVEDVILDP